MIKDRITLIKQGRELALVTRLKLITTYETYRGEHRMFVYHFGQLYFWLIVADAQQKSLPGRCCDVT